MPAAAPVLCRDEPWGDELQAARNPSTSPGEWLSMSAAVYASLSRFHNASSSTRAQETTRRLPGASRSAYPATTPRACRAGIRPSTRPKMTHTGSAGSTTGSLAHDAGHLRLLTARTPPSPRCGSPSSESRQPGTRQYRSERVWLPETTCYPRPVSPIPVIVGGGEKRTLAIAARLGDGCHLPSDISTLDP